MRITLLGTGTPVLNLQRQALALSSLLVEIGNEKLLFDAGRGVTTQLVKANVLPQHINFVFITHHHYDHITDLGDLLLTSWHNGREVPLGIYGPHGTAAIVAALLRQVYARDIAFALFNAGNTVDIKDLAQVTEVDSGLIQDTGNWRVLAARVDHGSSLGLAYEDWPCLGYRVEAEGKVIAISGDTIACDGLDSLAQDADVLIQCCYLAEDEIVNPAFERLARHIIASSGQVGKIATRNKVKQLVLTHIRPKSEAMMSSLVKDVRKDYDGELIIGEDLMVIGV